MEKDKDVTELERAIKSRNDLLIKMIYSALLFVVGCAGVVCGVVAALDPNRVEILGVASCRYGFGPLVVSKTENHVYGLVAALFSAVCVFAAVFFHRRLSKAFAAEKRFIESIKKDAKHKGPMEHC